MRAGKWPRHPKLVPVGAIPSVSLASLGRAPLAQTSSRVTESPRPPTP
jgi:hypothetical protein